MAKIKSAETGRYTKEANSATTYKESTRKITVADAVKTLTKALREDEELYFAYQSNIAMSFFDAMKPRLSKSELTNNELGEAANKAAVNFMNLWIREQENPAEIDENIRENVDAPVQNSGGEEK